MVGACDKEDCSPQDSWEAKKERREGVKFPISLQKHVIDNLTSFQ
jgi:hypothetical protein